MTPDIDEWISAIKSSDPLTFEGAYHDRRPNGPGVVQRLISEMRTANDGYTRAKFIELIGEMGDESIVPQILPELTHVDQNVRQWAITALRALGGAEAERAIRTYEAAHPEEFL
jgi:HEAT repeat protein